MPKSSDASTSGVQSVDRALDLLDQLAASNAGLSAAELSRRTQLPYASTHRLLATLVARHYVDHDPTTRRYSLGPQLALAASRVSSLIEPWLRPHLRNLMEYCGETVNVAKLDDMHVVYVAQVQSTRKLRMFTEVGNRVLPHATAVGKVLLAQRSQNQVCDVLARTGMPALTAKTITDVDEFTAELKQVLLRGYAVDDEEGELGVRCVAVPLRGVPGEPLALSVSGPAGRLDPAFQARLIPQILSTAAEIAVSLAPVERLVDR